MFEFKLQDFGQKDIIFQIGIYAENRNDVNRFVSTLNFNIMFKFKLQDNQREEHYIPNWNLMPKTENCIYFLSEQNCLIFRIGIENFLI